MAASLARLEAELGAMHGESARPRLARGLVKQPRSGAPKKETPRHLRASYAENFAGDQANARRIVHPAPNGSSNSSTAT